MSQAVEDVVRARVSERERELEARAAGLDETSRALASAAAELDGEAVRARERLGEERRRVLVRKQELDALALDAAAASEARASDGARLEVARRQVEAEVADARRKSAELVAEVRTCPGFAFVLFISVRRRRGSCAWRRRTASGRRGSRRRRSASRRPRPSPSTTPR